MKNIFITGTDTGVGKTIVTGLLARFLLDRGYSVITQKWVETGSRNLYCDIDTHLRLMRIRRKHINAYLKDMTPYSFRFGSSPHLAAGLEKRVIRVEKIEKSYKNLSKIFDIVLVEGTGGALVPLNRNKLLIDVVMELRLPVLIVAGNKLGAINHTLLTVEALKRRDIEIIGIVFNNISGNTSDIVLKDNPRIIKRFLDEEILGILPRTKKIETLHRKFIPIGKKIFELIK